MSAGRRRLLMIAYHFPPLAGSSGIQRTLRFVQHLPALGWEPIVLTIRPSAYERTSDDLLDSVPRGVIVHRAVGFDAARQLAIGGRYAAWTARPDRWMSWRFDAINSGMSLIRRLQPRAIWSTYPIATSHVIGAALQRRSGLPWVADFRDPMAQEGYPEDPQTRNQYVEIERAATEHARLCLFTTPSALKMYQSRYPGAASRMALLENGYDEESFASRGPAETTPLHQGRLTLLHSGIVYPAERDPSRLFEALSRLRTSDPACAARVVLRFRAPVHEGLVLDLARRHGIQDQVEVLPPVGYAEALSEMLRADGLLVLQAANCNAQIPAKVYEYMRAARPVLCLSHPEGDTESVLRAAGIQAHARLDDTASIAAALSRFVLDVDSRSTERYLANADAVAMASRQGRAEALARWLHGLA